MLGLLHEAIGIFITALIGLSFAVAGVMRAFGCGSTILSGIIGSVFGIVVLFIAGLSEGAMIASIIVTIIATAGSVLLLNKESSNKSSDKNFQKASHSSDKTGRMKYIGKLMSTNIFQFTADIPVEEAYGAICQKINASADMKAIIANMQIHKGNIDNGLPVVHINAATGREDTPRHYRPNAMRFTRKDAAVALVVERIENTTAITFGEFSINLNKDKSNERLLIFTLWEITVEVLEEHCSGAYNTVIAPITYWRS